MTNYSTPNAFLLIGGRDLSGDQTVKLEDMIEQINEQCDGIGDNYEKYKGVGLARITLEASGGLYDDAATKNVAALQSQAGVDQLVLYGFQGYRAAASPLYGQECMIAFGALVTKWKRIISREALTKAHAEYVLSGRALRSRILHGLVAETSDPGNTEGSDNLDENTALFPAPIPITASATNDQITTTVPHGLITGDVIFISGHTGSTPDINGQQTVTVVSETVFTIGVDITVAGTGGSLRKLTSTGSTADLHVTALALGGFTNITIKVRHSADDITYSDLHTFTAVTTSPFANRQTSGATVQRYTAVSWDYSGAGSGQTCTFIVALARH